MRVIQAFTKAPVLVIFALGMVDMPINHKCMVCHGDFDGRGCSMLNHIDIYDLSLSFWFVFYCFV